MPAYFASDIHLRIDRPDRGQRFARWVSSLERSDTLVIAGDLCDFWFASRQRGQGLDPLRCPGLKALAERVSRGGSLTIMLGNHDPWLGPFYADVLGAQIVAEPLELEAHGLRLHLVHGHLLGARSFWKGAMESRAFLHGFGLAPGFVVRRLEGLLKQTNELGRAASDRRHFALYRRYADNLEGHADLAIFGHIHRPHDDTSRPVRMVVLGSWTRGSSYLMIDDKGATLVTDIGTD